MNSRIVSNIGIGKVEATFENLTTTGSDATQQDFTQAMVDADRVAACLIGSNEAGFLTTTYPLLGAVQAVSEDDDPNHAGQLDKIVVQVAGVASIAGTTGTVAVRTNRSDKPCGVNGFAACFTTTNIARYSQSRGLTINVWDTQRMDILF